MRIALVSDAWLPQINGVVTTYRNLRAQLLKRGHEFHVIHPGHFPNVPCPMYSSLRLAVFVRRRLERYLNIADFDVVHIATEGPLGWAARRWCLKNDFPFTTSYHTQFPQYLNRYIGMPQKPVYELMRRFHAPAFKTFVPTPSVRNELRDRGFDNLTVWTRGVDSERFYPGKRTEFLGVNGPLFLYCGRVAKEKGIEKFLELDLPGTKVVIGDGPQMPALQKRFPGVIWTGFLQGEELAKSYRSADVFVFPSETDTFGVVQLEALASGLPVAALPVTGPRDVLTDPKAAVLSWDLREACLKCLALNKEDAVAFGRGFRWEKVADMFVQSLKPAASHQRGKVEESSLGAFVSAASRPF